MAVTTGQQSTSTRGHAAALKGGDVSVAHANWRDARYQAFALSWTTPFELDITYKTVEAHRAKIMNKMAVSSLSGLMRVVEAAGPDIGSP